jgi:predicted Zn-dependent protease
MWHDPEDRLQKAVDRFEAGDVAGAAAMLRGLERMGVISPRIELYLGHCHLEEDRPQAALRRYRRAVALRPMDASAWVGLALCHGHLGGVERAVEALQRAAALDPTREDVHCHLVHCYALQGRIREAEAHARRARRLDPECPHVHRHLAVAYLLADRPAQALDAWRRVEALHADHPEIDLGIARALAALDRRDEARVRYAAALRGDYAADAHAGLGELARLQGRLERAAEHFRNAILLDADHHEARLRLAEALGGLGRLDEGVRVLRAAPAAATSDPDHAFVTAGLLSDLGRRSAGLRTLRALVGERPHAAGAWVALGRHLLDRGRLRVAVRVLRRGLRRCGERDTGVRIGAVRALARALGRLGRRREAVAVLARAAHRRPESFELHLDVAAALLARGRVAAGERALLKGLVAVPDASALWAAAAELALETGRPRLARRRIREALRHNPRHGHALSLLVRWWIDRGDGTRAAHAARAAMRVLPPDDGVVKEHGRALLLSGRAAEALLPLRRYVLAAPGHPEGFRLLARAFEAQGDVDAARTQRRLEAAVTAGA